MEPLKIMFISNGKGEDSIACTILNGLKQVISEEEKPEVKVKVLPLVGNGRAYEKADVDVVANWKELPSGGFGGQRVSSFLKDIYAGLHNITKEQISVLHNESATVNLIVAVGDIYPVALAAFFTNKPIVHIATAISANFHKYTWLERWIFKKYCRLVITRDKPTVQYLEKRGVPSAYYGNAMMDDPALAAEGISYIPAGKRLVALAPSSREDAYENTIRMLKVIQETGNRPSIEWALSLAPSLVMERLEKAVEKAGWKLEYEQPNAKGYAGQITRNGVNPVKIIVGHFGDVVRSSTIVIGMTGTGNEQVVGFGKPIFLLRGKGANSTWRRMIQYRKLLGESIYIAWGWNKKIADELIALINRPGQLKKMGDVGKKHMGGPGGAYGISRAIFREAMKNYHA